VLSARRKGLLDEVAAACAAAGGPGCPPCELFPFDLADPAARRQACAQILAAGPLDGIFLNAGMSQRATFIETPPEAFAAVMGLDFDAPVDLLRLCLPAMLERRSGFLVAVSSIAGLAGSPLRPAYSAAKHAIAGLFQCLRSELLGSGLRVVTVYPGYVRTAIARTALGPGGKIGGEEDVNIAAGADPALVAGRILDAALAGPMELKLAFDLKSRFGLFLSRRFPLAWASLSAKHAHLGNRGWQPRA
jgi:NAD(P)-dependent dehydrogenase (short-subunit alcohol dehydrogenase family)